MVIKKNCTSLAIRTIQKSSRLFIYFYSFFVKFFFHNKSFIYFRLWINFIDLFYDKFSPDFFLKIPTFIYLFFLFSIFSRTDLLYIFDCQLILWMLYTLFPGFADNEKSFFISTDKLQVTFFFFFYWRAKLKIRTIEYDSDYIRWTLK